MVGAVRDLGKPALVTSAPARPGEIGLACCTPEGSTLFAHARLQQAPNGTGDLVTAVFAAGLVQGLAGPAAAERAARAVVMALEAEDTVLGLPIMTLGARLMRPQADLRIEPLA